MNDGNDAASSAACIDGVITELLMRGIDAASSSMDGAGLEGLMQSQYKVLASTADCK